MMRFSTTTAITLCLAATPSLAASSAAKPEPTTVSLFLSDNSTDTDIYAHVYASVIGVSGPLTTYALRIADHDLLATTTSLSPTTTTTGTNRRPSTTTASESNAEMTITHGPTTVAHTLVDIFTESGTVATLTGSFNCVVKPTTEATCSYGHVLTVGTSGPTTETATETYTHLNYAVATVTAGMEKLGAAGGDEAPAGQDKAGDKNAAGRMGGMGLVAAVAVGAVFFGGVLV